MERAGGAGGGGQRRRGEQGYMRRRVAGAARLEEGHPQVLVVGLLGHPQVGEARVVAHLEGRTASGRFRWCWRRRRRKWRWRLVVELPAQRRIPLFRPGRCAVHVEARPWARECGVDPGESGLAVRPALRIAGEHRKAAEARCQERSLQRHLLPAILPPRLSLLTPHVHHSERRHDAARRALTTCGSGAGVLGLHTPRRFAFSVAPATASGPKDKRSS